MVGQNSSLLGFSRTQLRTFTVTRWQCVEAKAIEDRDMFLYRNEKKMGDRIIYHFHLLPEDSRTLADLIYEYNICGKILPFDVTRISLESVKN